jgi:hypothetical protein
MIVNIALAIAAIETAAGAAILAAAIAEVIPQP